jgi:hypothetical protein
MEFRPVDNGLFIVLQVESDFDVVGHQGREIDFIDLDNIGNEVSADAEVEGALAYDDC